MNSLKLRRAILLLLICNMTLSCISLQQPLPGSLWGGWTFIKTGTIINNGNERLYNYNNVCYKESDRLRFSSDNKMSLRWYDEACTIQEYLIGRYQVQNNILKVDLAESRRYQDSPFPPIREYRIVQINSTTLKLVEIANDNRRNRGRGGAGNEPLVFVFMKLD